MRPPADVAAGEQRGTLKMWECSLDTHTHTHLHPMQVTSPLPRSQINHFCQSFIELGQRSRETDRGRETEREIERQTGGGFMFETGSFFCHFFPLFTLESLDQTQHCVLRPDEGQVMRPSAVLCLDILRRLDEDSVRQVTRPFP